MLYLSDSLATIKMYAIISIIASVDNKMLAMITNIDTEGDMVNQPLEFDNADTSAITAIKRIVKKYQEGRSKLNLSSVVVTIVMAF